MKQFNVTGMTCAACSARVEKAVKSLPGAENVSVSLLTNSLAVEGPVSAEAVIKAVTDAGYGCSEKGVELKAENTAKELEDMEQEAVHSLRNRLIGSIVFLVPLMYLSMGHMMWGWWVPGFIGDSMVVQGMLQMLLTGMIMVINQRFFISGFKAVIHRSPNMDTLVALGSAASFLWSVYAMYWIAVGEASGNMHLAHEYMHQLYFESAGMILALITVGKLLEAFSKGKTTSALKALLSLAPDTAVVIRDGQEVTIPADDMNVGDIFIVRPGGSIPADGEVVEGTSSVDEASLTGESVPVDKSKGSEVFAGTMNMSGFIKCKATKVKGDTSLAKVIQLVSDTAATKAPIAKMADRVSGVFVPIVMGIAIIAFVVWMICSGGDVSFSIARAVSILVISCPCALGLATPVAIMVGSGVGSRSGILFKTAAALEHTGRAKIVVLDKTGTITKGKPSVTDVIPVGVSSKELMEYAYALESKSEHPLSRAIIKKARHWKVPLTPADDFKAVHGKGLKGTVNGREILAGSLSWISHEIGVPNDLSYRADELSHQGKTPLLFSMDGRVIGIIAVADTIKSDSAEAIAQLKAMNIKTVMLTGDNEKTANAIGKQAGVDMIIANVLPDGKEEAIRQLQQEGVTIMVGDGINDAPALTRADIGMAIGAGTDVAIDSADVVLMNSRLTDAVFAISLGRKTLRNIKENLFWAFIYNVIGIPIAAGVLYPFFGWVMNPMFGAAAMSLSSFCVVMNALRLNLIRKKSPPLHAEDDDDDKEGEIKMITTKVTVTGMMCPRCESHVSGALSKLPGVTEVSASAQDGVATIISVDPLNEDMVKDAITNEGYEFVEMKQE